MLQMYTGKKETILTKITKMSLDFPLSLLL